MGTSSRCAACKYLRKRCSSDCIFSPHFPSNGPRRFEFVHRIYGASNLARMLQRIPEQLREQAADTLYFEAKSRIEDPVYGCVRIIHQLQQDLNAAQNQLVNIQAEISLLANSYGPAQTYVDSEIGPNHLDNFIPQLCYGELGPFEEVAFSAQSLSPSRSKSIAQSPICEYWA